jgi:hypothetical protein
MEHRWQASLVQIFTETMEHRSLALVQCRLSRHCIYDSIALVQCRLSRHCIYDSIPIDDGAAVLQEGRTTLRMTPTKRAILERQKWDYALCTLPLLSCAIISLSNNNERHSHKTSNPRQSTAATASSRLLRGCPLALVPQPRSLLLSLFIRTSTGSTSVRTVMSSCATETIVRGPGPSAIN